LLLTACYSLTSAYRQANLKRNKYHQKQKINQVSLHPISRNHECIPALKGPNIILNTKFVEHINCIKVFITIHARTYTHSLYKRNK
jgi:hypothetical protein